MGNTDAIGSKLESYFVNDFNVVYEITTKSVFKSILISGLVNNVFGKKYISNGYYYTYDDTWSDPDQITTIEGAGYYPQATTNFLIGQIEFEILVCNRIGVIPNKTYTILF